MPDEVGSEDRELREVPVGECLPPLSVPREAVDREDLGGPLRAEAVRVQWVVHTCDAASSHNAFRHRVRWWGVDVGPP